MSELPEGLQVYDVKYLPIVRAYAQKIGLVEEINRQVDSEMEISPGTFVLAMVLDTLSGRSPLYRLQDFFAHQDVELLLGEDHCPQAFHDDNAGRVLDKIYQAGSMKLFTSCALRACEVFGVEGPYFHFDSTTRSVMGEYLLEEQHDLPFVPTYGYSKDKRPDLKQFVLSTLCVNHNVPILGSFEDGNASDKKLNNELLNRLSEHLGNKDLEQTIYIADSAVVTEKNLAALEQQLFITRLPASYKECGRVIEEAVEAQEWEEVGVLAKTPGSVKRPCAHYRVYESQVKLYGKKYRAVVVHSSSNDKRRQKRLEREQKASLKEVLQVVKQQSPQEYACEADAQAAAQRLRDSRWGYHRLAVEVEQRPTYGKGRPPKDRPRPVKELRYGLRVSIQQREKVLERKRMSAGCFVLLTSVPTDGELGHAGVQVLQAYKEQHGLEQNYGFLKDPVIINSLYLKRPERLEALGLVLLLALLIWRLMERTMRAHVNEQHSPLVGLDNKDTKRPTSFMMTTKFTCVMVAKVGQERRLVSPFSKVQRSYLVALGVRVEAFTHFELRLQQDGW